SPELPDLLRAAGFSALSELAYPVGTGLPEKLIQRISENGPDQVLFVFFNSGRDPEQRKCYQLLQSRCPEAVFLAVSAGMPELENPAAIDLCTYRPPTMQALVNFLSK